PDVSGPHRGGRGTPDTPARPRRSCRTRRGARSPAGTRRGTPRVRRASSAPPARCARIRRVLPPCGAPVFRRRAGPCRSAQSSSCCLLAENFIERRETRGEIDLLAHVLLQEPLHARPERERLIHARVAAPLVCAYRDEVAMLLVCREYLAELPRRGQVAARGDLVHRTADGGLDVDGRIMAALGNLP